ncbi:zinc-dependent metalloprotease [Candidatus Uabimicrobium amorphum]|uniref:Peptidase n=1 Tax=Uabimicrobium amorphum TaxID=2596890 RepID=A0A5S9IQU2_UABAM|nr:zinc-dependent metalloprotease [Candidatus Uabimicrobium amorphum]BBM85490.1 hypothetical protein UABAM_03859 [Candidatus Uabimicrobium amorphum]
MKNLLCVLLVCMCSLVAQTITSYTKNMKKHQGFFTFYWEEDRGQLFLEIENFQQQFLYVNYLTTGVGSNDIGLDRGQLGDNRVVYFSKVGGKVLLIEPNLKYRAITENIQERRSVEEAFAKSVLAGFHIVAREDSRVLVNASQFFLRDVHNVIEALQRSNQGKYMLDKNRSALYVPRCKSFPQNTEIEALLTFAGKAPGNWVRSVTPTPTAITVRQHHSFVQLPDNKYRVRHSDPRGGFFTVNFANYSAKPHQDMSTRLIRRHRLQKKFPQKKISEPVKAITYYVDNGIPEPIKSAIIEGASWWNEAFTAAGYKDAFQVKILPKNVDPQDIRYNVIQWIHRSTRGWSYGPAVVDPRTGEIIKAHVVLGSLRIRQDYLISEGLLSPYVGKVEKDNPMLKLALARLRQLAAHEVGHTLGLRHNFAASVNERASVMDYPHPKVKINEDSSFDLSDAYAVGIGEWDKVAIQFGYQTFVKDEQRALQKILKQAQEFSFISDSDARPAGSAHPYAHLWDNGRSAVNELEHVLEVRRLALKRFGENSIPPGTPWAKLHDVLVPIYFFHRYQTEAAAKLIGGLNYTYAARGDGQLVTKFISSFQQKRALDMLLKTLHVDHLAISEKIVKLIPPRPEELPQTRELLPRRTGVTFDPLSAAQVAANFTLSLLLNPQRASRLVEFHARNPSLPSLEMVIDSILLKTWYRPLPKDRYEARIHEIINDTTLTALIRLAKNDNVHPQVQAIAGYKLKELSIFLEDEVENLNIPLSVVYYSIQRMKSMTVKATTELKMPPGSPIGCCESLHFK